MTKKSSATCLIVSYGPVPTPKNQTVEGGGMRAWGLASGLASHGVDVTLAINNSFPQEITQYQGIKIINWGLDDAFIQTLNSFDSVLVSYCMGDPSVFIAENINPGVQLLLDVYVPIYVEVSARDSKDIVSEYKNYLSDIARHNTVLKRGDYFLCANEAQKDLYMGVLSSLGIINPRSYRNERIQIVPFGINESTPKATQNPYKKLGIKDSDNVVMWFGGLYPWFRIEELLGALSALSKHPSVKFVFVGGKNPFNPNPDFSRQYDATVAYAKKHKILNKSVFFVDWVDYDDRINWYQHTDLVISLNQPGDENKYSWRTRVMDYVWGELTIITNGGDPLSEDLLENGAAIRLPTLSSAAITETILDNFKDRKLLAAVTKNIKTLKPKYYWPAITQPLYKIIDQHTLPYTDEKIFQEKLGVSYSAQSDSKNHVNNLKLGRIVSKSRKVFGYARRKGLRQSIKLATSIVRSQFKSNKSAAKRSRRYIFISHPIDNTGAPLVLLDIVEEYAKKYGSNNIQLVAPGITDNQRERMQRIGVKVDKAALGISFRLIRLQLALRADDFVLMNTVAIYDNYRDFILIWLTSGRLKHANWFIHEDLAQIPIIHKEFLETKNLEKVKQLINTGKLTLLTPSKKTAEEYNNLLKITNARPVNLNIQLDEKFKKQRTPNEYKEVNFLLSGTPTDGRKGQLIAISAFYAYIKTFYEKNPEKYRDFKLHLVAIGEDYLSQQIKWIGSSELKENIEFYPSLPRDEALDISAKCTAVICCSLNETFGLYIAEGMSMGHIVLRNNSSGMEEQLIEGKNGYFIDHTDINQMASVIEKILNKKTSTDDDLYKMGRASQNIISNYQKNSYHKQIGD